MTGFEFFVIIIKIIGIFHSNIEEFDTDIDERH